MAQTARSLGLGNVGNTPQPSNRLRRQAFAQDQSLPTSESLPPPSLPALPALTATHALIALPALPPLPAPAIPGPSPPPDPTKPNTRLRHQPLPTTHQSLATSPVIAAFPKNLP